MRSLASLAPLGLLLAYFTVPSTQADVYVLVSNPCRVRAKVSRRMHALFHSPSAELPLRKWSREVLQGSGLVCLHPERFTSQSGDAPFPTSFWFQTKQYILEPLPSLQADFGPPINAEGIDGLLKVGVGVHSSGRGTGDQLVKGSSGFLARG